MIETAPPGDAFSTVFKSLLLLFFCAFPFAPLMSAAQAEVVCDPGRSAETELTFWRYHAGDSVAWSAIEYDDSAWALVRRHSLFYQQKRGVHWLRTRIVVPDNRQGFPLILKLGRIQSAFEVYCNGKLIGSNGRVGLSMDAEHPGKLFFAVLLDPHIRVGENVLAIRYSNFHFTPPGFFFYAKIDSGLHANLFYFELQLWLALFVGIVLAGAVLGLALFLIGPRYSSFFFFFLLCLSLLVSSAFRLLMHYRNISLEVLRIFEPVFVGSHYVVELSIVLFTLFLFGFRFKRFHIIGAFLVSFIFYLGSMQVVSIRFLNFANYARFMMVYVFLLVILSLFKRKKGSAIALAGYSIFTLGRFESLGLFDLPAVMGAISPPLFVLICLLVVNRQVREQQLIRKAAESRAHRLEFELLKKTIQPHFLMNTLASLQSWSKRNADKAEQMTQAIADLFRRINQVVEKKRIPLTEELAICRSHLDLMEFRRDARYSLLVEDGCKGVQIPPLILHTLVENGLSHAMKPREDGYFKFSCQREKNAIRLTLSNNGSLLKNGIAGEPEDGTGLKYVKSRLQESFPGRWRLDSGIRHGLWVVEIRIKEK